MRRILSDRADKPGSSASLTSAETDLLYGGLRHWGLTQIRLERMAKRKPDPVLAMLLSVVFGALRRSYRPPALLVSQAVQAAQSWSGVPGARFVNAILRQTLSDPLSAAQDMHHPTARWNAPTWWIEAMHESLGERTAHWLDHQQRHPPLTVRYMGPAEQRQAWIEALCAQGLRPWSVGPALPRAFHIEPARSVTQLPGFSQGWFRVQDVSAQRCFGWLPLKAGQTVWDVCAAPGGKTFLAAEQAGVRIYASDASESRLNKLQAEWARLNTQLAGTVSVQTFDPLVGSAWPAHWPDQFDHLILDLPCSASGVVRRHPEIPWRRTPDQLRAVSALQWDLLKAVWPRLRPGGEALLVTCSVFTREGEELARRWQNEPCHVERLTAPGLLLAEGERVGDGFFIARFRKRM
ncbi:MAG: ribosomal small subunit methyltransferase [Pseudomonadota bacterium]|jgi:16S rRNA (cytosine967-C5)-methyltransferase